MTPEQLKALSAALTAHEHRFVSSDLHDFVAEFDDNDLQNWKDIGSPYVWHFVEFDGGLNVYYDSAYGLIALFCGDNLLGWGQHEIVIEGAVVLDKDYYGASKYLWF